MLIVSVVFYVAVVTVVTSFGWGGSQLSRYHYAYEAYYLGKVGYFDDALQPTPGYNGTWRTWYRDYKPRTEAGLLKGMQHGVFRKWDESGLMFYEGYFENGMMHGTIKLRHPNGKLRFEGDYFKGAANGLHREWADNGTLIAEQNFKKGVRHGEWKKWNREGELMQVMVFDYDMAIRIDTYKNGKLASTVFPDPEDDEGTVDSSW